MFPGSLVVDNSPVKQEIQVQSLGGEDPLEKKMATSSGILAWEIPWTEEPGGLQSKGSHRVRQNWSDLGTYIGLYEEELLILFRKV